MPFPRHSGILLHPTSLPGPCGSGDLGPAAFHFVDWLSCAEQTLWQVLPLGGIGPGNSPYMSPSAFAGNELLIDLERLLAAGWLRPSELEPRPDFSAHQIDYAALRAYRLPHLHRAAERFFADVRRDAQADFADFCAEHSDWLDDYALFMALDGKFGAHGKVWQDWPAPLAKRSPGALAKAAEELAEACRFWRFCQWCFHRQWDALRQHAHTRGVELVGDMPIFVSPHSADVWAHQHLFDLDAGGRPRVVAGVPPDYFSATGQHWGNPLYRWPAHAAEGYAWWIARLRHTFRLCDVVRIDHFRGFESYYSIPAGNKTAAGGHWEKGPDRDFINAMHENLGEGGIIAEDLGYLTPEVKAMLSASGYPGMKIMQFAFDSRESGNYLPHTYHRNSVVYTGTHDNVTTEGWRTNASAEDVAYACRYLRCQPEELTEAMICACLASVSDTAVIPLADWLHLGSEARINTPSTQGSNWQWRLTQPLTPALSAHIAELTALYHRVPGEEL